MQEVQLDSKIKLLDSPGVVFASSSNESTDNEAALKNAMRVESLKDPVTPATAILKRANRKLMMELYDIVEYNSPEVKYFHIVNVAVIRKRGCKKQ